MVLKYIRGKSVGGKCIIWYSITEYRTEHQMALEWLFSKYKVLSWWHHLSSWSQVSDFPKLILLQSFGRWNISLSSVTTNTDLEPAAGSAVFSWSVGGLWALLLKCILIEFSRSTAFFSFGGVWKAIVSVVICDWQRAVTNLQSYCISLECSPSSGIFNLAADGLFGHLISPRNEIWAEPDDGS